VTDIEEIQKYFNKRMQDRNNQGLPDFEGYSPMEMQFILYNTFEANSPIQLMNVNDSDCERIPILNQLKYLLRIIEEQEELKLKKKAYGMLISPLLKQNYL